MSQILVIGAGPTGLFLTYLLKKRGLDVRLIDKKSDQSIHSKALGIHSRTLEILEKEGLRETFEQAGIHLEGAEFHNSDKSAQADFSGIDIPYPYVLSLPQTETERLLIQELEKLGQKIEWNCEVSGYEGNNPIIGKKAMHYSWVIACDGAHSITRKSHSDFTFKGSSLYNEILLADVLAKSPFTPNKLHILFKKKLVSMIFPMKGERYRVMFAHKEVHDFKEDELAAVLDKYGFPKTFEINEIIWLNNFKLSERMVNTFRDGNLFVLGDAAHVHSPFLGQGMNTCFQDAYNLAWKLELVIKKMADKKLLDSFSDERLPIVRGMLRKTSSMTKALAGEKVPSTILFRVIQTIMRFSGIRKAILKNFSMVTLGYSKSPITYESPQDLFWKAPAIGFRPPNIDLGDGSCLFDHLKTTKHVLVYFNPNSQVKPTALYDTLLITDPKAQQSFAAKTQSLFLIRPDGHLGFRSKEGSYTAMKIYLDRLNYCEDREGMMINV